MNLFEPLGVARRLLHSLFLRARSLLPVQQSMAFGHAVVGGRDHIADIHVINLDRQPERLSAVRRELDRIVDAASQPLSLRLIRHPACDARAFPLGTLESPDIAPYYTLADQLFVEPQPHALPANFDLGRPIRMSDAEVAVAQSHIDVWRKIATSAAPYALVLEDDVWFERGFGRLVDTAWREMSAADQAEPFFDVLYLSYKEVRHGAPKTSVSQSVFRPERGLWYLSGYVLSQRGAERLLALLPCRGPVDLWINQKFHEMDVRAVRRSVIAQRLDLQSTNSYSILPALSQIGVLNDGTPGKFRQRPTETPVFAFGASDSRLSSLAMALSMLGYRCCCDLDALPHSELDRLLDGRHGRIFDAYVNVASLAQHITKLRQRYPSARFIVCGSGPLSAEIAALLTGVGQGVLHLDEDRAGDWRALCEHLRLAPPSAGYPSVPGRGNRTLRSPSSGRPALATGKSLRHDVSPWVVPARRGWEGIEVNPVEPPAPSVRWTRFEDDLLAIQPSRWMLREDTFPGNLALFRPANVSAGPLGVELQVAQASLGVRNMSAAAISSRERFLYGRFEATLQATDVPGLVTGFFLHRDSPRQEIDVEITGDRPDRILANVFYNPGSDGARFDYGYRGTPASIDLGFDASKAFHTYAIEWEPDEIRWLVDGRLVHRRVLWDPTPIPHLPMTLHVNTWPTRSRELAGRLVVHALPAAARIRRIAVDAINAHGPCEPSSSAPQSDYDHSVVTA
ncbi:family 16 glycosylhydrolase [Lysobacter yangpyeongensis]|uniref:Beta-glucanase n=1 Tax=Lysobacter yangpyeongensis TaxID=346182 RepID=A0ABW0SP31_9GAMM